MEILIRVLSQIHNLSTLKGKFKRYKFEIITISLSHNISLVVQLTSLLVHLHCRFKSWVRDEIERVKEIDTGRERTSRKGSKPVQEEGRE